MRDTSVIRCGPAPRRKQPITSRALGVSDSLVGEKGQVVDAPDADEAHGFLVAGFAEDTLAWGLFRTGRCEEARLHSAHALRLGTRDALLFFHRGMIERCLRSTSARAWFERALATNPHFSILWAPVARRALG